MNDETRGRHGNGLPSSGLFSSLLPPPSSVLILGASARAAAFSALRAGLRPWCADLFADADLLTRCPAVRVTAKDYVQVFLELASRKQPGPWMYTGGLENRSDLVGKIAERRPLWGNGPQTLRL